VHQQVARRKPKPLGAWREMQFRWHTNRGQRKLALNRLATLHARVWPKRDACTRGPGMATVLIVEDQTQILALARALLEEEGYKTLTAPSAEDALVILAGSEPVDTLFVDIILNGDMQAGIDLAKRAIELKPGLKVVYSTGLTLTHEIKALLVPGAVILEKPYTLAQLLTSLEPGA